ncbi:SDR family NAD(P)-dependent oxidoreductase [Tumidithrix helvetica PCC 7403]|uniref:SDR family NAD(P)-dependent oxidoreductase n=1 Tax=Tumidithrix helvetica TaxID=3457545 RepID=UPI003C8D09CD
MQAEAEALPLQEISSLSGFILITEDSLSVAPIVVQALQQKGASTAILARSTLQNPSTLIEAVTLLRQQYGSVTGIVHLAALDDLTEVQTIDDWRQATQIHAKSLFQLLHFCATDLQQAGQQQIGRVIATSCLGGYFGRSIDRLSSIGLPTTGASNGLLKTFMAECEGLQTKAVDFDRRLSAPEIAERVIQEFLVKGRSEVGYPQGERKIFRTVPAPFASTHDASNWVPTSDAVVLATGGARGITAEIVAELAAYGLTLIVTGLSPLPVTESAATLGITSEPMLRQMLIGQALKEGTTPTPVQIERQLKALLRDRTIRQNLERFRNLGARVERFTRQNLERFQDLGAKVEYLSADVRDDRTFGDLIDGIYARYGRLDAVIHGAGIIEDKLISDKSAESFDRVFDTKADSAFILSRHLRSESLKLLVFFTSVAGRYGNRGQSDYAAANEVVNRLAWKLNHQWSEARVLAINWGPWDTTGMASEDVKRQFRDRGIIPIPLDAGQKFFADELQWGKKSEVEVIAGEGPWEAYEAQQAQKQDFVENPAIASAEVSPPTKFVFLPQQPQLQANGTLTLDYTLSVGNDPYLKDHCLDGKPVMPATGALEWIAEFVQAGWPEWKVAQVKDLRVFRGLVIETSAGRNIRFKARAASHADAESMQVSAEIIDPDNNLPFYRATVVLQPTLEMPPQTHMQRLSTSSLKHLDPNFAYSNYLFHGHEFQLVQAIDCAKEEGIDARVIPSRIDRWRPQATNQSHWLFDPGMLDTAPQMAIVWARLHRDTTALPSRFGIVTRYASAKPHPSLRLALRVTQVSDHSLTYDADFFDEMGNIYLQMQQIESTCNSALNRLATPHE